MRLEIVPFGRTVEEQERIDRKKAAGLRGVKGCFIQVIILGSLVIAVCLYGIWK